MDISLACVPYNGAWDAVTVALTSGILMGWAAQRAARAFLPALRGRVMPRLAGMWINRKRERYALARAGGDLAAGKVVRFRGVVEAERVVCAELSGLPSVLCRHQFGERDGAAFGKGLTARDFLVRLADGTSVRVWAQAAADEGALVAFDARAQEWNGAGAARGWFSESRISPGDEVEVVAQVEQRLDLHAPRLRDREAPLSWIARAAQRAPLLLVFRTQKPLAA